MSESKKRKRDELASAEAAEAAEPAADTTQEAEEDIQVQSHKERRKARKLEKKLATQPTSDTLNADIEVSPQSPLEESKPTKSSTSKSKTKEKEDTPPDPQRQPRQNSVWVGNLAFKTCEKDLRQFFDGVGEITRIYMPTKKTGGGAGKFKDVKGDNMGFAYVDFATSDAKTIAITLSEGNLGGRKLLIKDGSDFSGRPTVAPVLGSTDPSTSTDPTSGNPSTLTTTHTKTEQKIIRAQTQPASATLFMGNLPFQATEESIQGMLEAHRKSRLARKRGKDKKRDEKEEEEKEAEKELFDKTEEKEEPWLRKIRLGTFEDSGKCKGWAFLDFTTVEESTSALLDIRNHHMDGRDVKLEYASPDATRRGEGKSQPGTGKTKVREGKKERLAKKQALGGEEGEAVEEDEEPSPKKRRRDDRGPSEREERLKARSKRMGKAGDEDEAEDSMELDQPEQEQGQRRPRPGPGEYKGREGKPKYKARTKPGAALALAKRENVAIVPSEGVKIKF